MGIYHTFSFYYLYQKEPLIHARVQGASVVSGNKKYPISTTSLVVGCKSQKLVMVFITWQLKIVHQTMTISNNFCSCQNFLLKFYFLKIYCSANIFGDIYLNIFKLIITLIRSHLIEMPVRYTYSCSLFAVQFVKIDKKHRVKF